MNFQESYYASASTSHGDGQKPSPSILIPDIYTYPADTSPNKQLYTDFLHLLGGGKICLNAPASFSFQPMPCSLIIYTGKGGGTLSCLGDTVSVPERTFTFFDCSRPFSLHSQALPWNFLLYFLGGRDLSLYGSVLSPFGIRLRVSDYSSVKKALYSLPSISARPDTPDVILMHKNLSEILGSLCLYGSFLSSHEEKPLPDYLVQMHDLLHFQYGSHFSLEMCEKLLHVSRYRLCREFSAAYGIPPLKYLIARRLEEAKKMLLTTDLTIREISSKVGYDNVNHFINLFKKDTGLTPGSFRQKARAGQSSPRCPAQ